MRIVVYDCVTGDALTEKYGRTGAAMIDWIAPHLPEADLSWIHIAGGVAPPDPGTLDGVIVSGSEKGVYDDVPWMAPLRANLLALKTAGKAVYGICFGHQIMADVYGGRAEKAAGGFVTGARAFDTGRETVEAYVAHQDQVTLVPPGATVTASASYCPVAALAYDFPAMSVQFHPEYDAAFTRDLIDMFGPGLMPPDALAAARASLPGKVPPDLCCAEIAAFFRRHAGRADRI